MDSITQIALASPFNTILWRVVAMDEAAYHVGWYSLFDPDKTYGVPALSDRPGLLAGIGDHWPVTRLQWLWARLRGLHRYP